MAVKTTRLFELPANLEATAPDFLPILNERLRAIEEAHREVATVVNTPAAVVAAAAVVAVPRARAVQTVLQGIADSTDTALTFDAAEFDNGIWTLGAPTKLIAPSDGLYRIMGQVAFAASAAGVRRILVVKNGVTANAVAGAVAPGTAAFEGMAGVACEVELLAADEIQFYVWQNTGGPLNTATNRVPFGSMVRVADKL